MPSAERYVATGTSGFVGRALAQALEGRVHAVHLGVDGWAERLPGVPWRDAVVFHLAARVHRGGNDDEAACERDNVEKSRAVALAAAAGGARRLVYLSTIKVSGEESSQRPLRAEDPPNPGNAYSRSKWRAEQALAACGARSGLETVIVRSPLVIGPSAQGNLSALMRLADSAWPLPFASLDNRRSFIARGDLVELLLRCAHAPVAGRTLLAGDPDVVSAPRMLRVLRNALGRPARLYPMPAAVLETVSQMAGKGDLMRRFTRSLELDAREAMRALEWQPRISIDDALREMATAWKSTG